MKMKNLFKFFCMMILCVMGQIAWAQSGVITRSFYWNEEEGFISDNFIKQGQGGKTQMVRMTEDGVQITLASDSNVTKLDNVLEGLWKPRRFALGSVGAYGEADATLNGAISWTVPDNSFRVEVSSVTTTTKVGGYQCVYALGDNAPQEVDYHDGYLIKSFDEQTAAIQKGATYVPFYFAAGPERTEKPSPAGQAALQRLGMTYAVYPNAPVWDKEPMLITVDSTNIHWYVLADHFTVGDDYKNTLKFDVKVLRGGEKYVFWNEDSTAFYMLKKIDFEIKAWIDPYQGKWDYYEYEYVGGYNASDVTTQKITSQVPKGEPAHIFFYNEDELIRDFDAEGCSYVKYLTSVPVEHFVEYVCVYTDTMKYNRKDSAVVSYVEGVRDRRDYFHMRGNDGTDMVVVKIGAAVDTLKLIGTGSEPNRVPFIIDSEKKFGDLKHSSKNVVWDANWTDAKETQGVANVVRFQGDFVMFTERQYKIHFVGVPDSLFYEYGNAVGTDGNGTFTVEWSADGSKWYTLRTITGKKLPSKNQQFYDSIQLDKTAQWLRFNYTDAQNAAYVKNIKVTEFKRLYANPADSLITFPTVKRAPGQYLTEYATLAWANLAPELIFDAKDPFSVKSRIKVRLDQFDTIFANNKFAVLESLDNAGEFYQRMKISSLDYTQPMATYVTINGKVIFDTEDMFAAFVDSAYNVKKDTVAYGDTVVFAIKDSLNTILTHDSLIVTYTMDGDTIVGDTLIGACVGAHTIVATALRNSFVTEDWADTLYIYVRESEKDTITFNVPAEIGMKDTLPADFVVTLDSVATLTYEFDKPEYFEVTAEGRLVAKKNAKADSVWVKVTASETCEHFSTMDSVRVWVRRVVATKFNDSVEWMTNVFGNDTLKDPLQVYNDDTTALENTDSLTIAFEYNPNDVVVDSVANQWYLRRSEEKDSLFVKVTVSGDSIKTVKDSIKFPVREYIASITWPGTIDDRGYYYVGDTLKVADFIATATNPERAGKDLTNLVNWTKTFVEAADGTVLEDGSVLLDSVNTSLLEVCLDTLFVKDTCAYDTLIVKPAVVKDLFFPGVDSIYVVGDSIAMKDILVKDTADRDISRYVRFNFEYIPEDFAHNTGDSLNMFVPGGMTDYIVLDKNGLDTAAVDTVVSRTQGGLVTEKEFKDRLLIAPVYAVSVVWADTVFTVGDTVRTDILTAIDGKGNDVTRYSSFIFVAADSVAERINDSTIVMAKAGQVMVKVVAKRNESMHQGKFSQILTVNPIKAKSVEGIANAYKVFDVLDTKTLVFRDTADNVIPAKYIAATYIFDETIASQNGDNITFNHVTDKMSITANLTGNVVGTPSVDVTVYPYDQAVIVYDTTAFVVGDEVNFNLFSVETADGKEIADSYYTFAYDVIDKADARIKTDSTSMIIDSLAAELVITMTSADIVAPVNPATFVIEAAKLDADRIEFPSEDFFVGEGFGINEIKVFTANNKNITEYAVNQLAFDYDNAEVRMSEDGDSIYFKKAGKIVITTTVGDLLINEKQFSNKMFVDQIQVDSILFPADAFTVDDTISAGMFRVFQNGVDVTEFVEDIRLSMIAQEGEKMADGRYVFIKKDAATVTAEVRGISGSKPFEKAFTYTVAPIQGDSFLLPATEFKVLDQIAISGIRYFQGEKEITKYVKNAVVTMNTDSATVDGVNITLDRAGQMTVNVQLAGNATGTLKQVITVDEYVNAIIALDKINFVLGDTLTADMFHLEDAQGNILTPKYGEFELDIEAGYGRVENNAIIFDKPGVPMINATFESEVKADPFAQTRPVAPTLADKVVFPTENYTVGDTAWVKDLKILDAQGRDITRFAQNGFKHITFDPYLAGETSLKEGYIAFNRPGTIQVKSGIQNDSVYYSDLSNTFFVDYLVATRIQLPAGGYTVGDQMKKTDVKVFAGDRDITEFADITINIDEKHGVGHYTAEGIVFDSAAMVDINVVVSGLGVKVLSKDTIYEVVPAQIKSVNLPAAATVLDVINTKDLIFRDANGKDITKYIKAVDYTFDPADAAHMEKDQMIFDKAGTLQVTATADPDGNAVGSVIATIEVAKFTNAEIKFDLSKVYYVADKVELRDFTVVDKTTGKVIDAQYDITLAVSAGDGHAAGKDIVLDSISPVTITATVTGQVEVEQNFYPSVLPANAQYVFYNPATGYTVGDSIAIADIVVKDSLSRPITQYIQSTDYTFNFVPATGAHAENGYIYFDEAGKVEAQVVINGSKTYPIVISNTISEYWFIDQAIAADVTMPTVFNVGETLNIADVKVVDAQGKDITAYADLFFIYDQTEAHAVNGGIEFDKANPKMQITVAIKGYENAAKASFLKEVEVKALAIVSDNLPTTANVFDVIDTKSVLFFDANGNDVTKYVDNVTYDFDNNVARLDGDNIVFENPGTVVVTATATGSAQGTVYTTIVVSAYTTATIELYPNKSFVVGDQITPQNFRVLDANGNVINNVTLDITCDPQEGTKDAKGNITFDKVAGDVMITVSVNGQVVTSDNIEVHVYPCNAKYVIYPAGPYVVGGSIAIADIVVLDSLSRDITKFAQADMTFDFDPQNAEDKNGNINFLHAGNTNVVATIGNALVNRADIPATMFIEQIEAVDVTMPTIFNVGETLKVSDVKVVDANGNDITAGADVFFIFDETEAHVINMAGDIEFDKANPQMNIVVAIKGYEDVVKVSFNKQVQVNGLAIVSDNLPTTANVFDAINTKSVLFFDANGNDVTKYVDNVTYDFDNNVARLVGDNIVFENPGTVVVTATATGSASGIVYTTIVVSAYTTATIELYPNKSFMVGEVITPQDFRVLDANGNVVSNVTIDITCDAQSGTKDAKGNITFIAPGTITMTVSVNGQVLKTDYIPVAVYKCVPNDVVYPSQNFVVSDVINVSDLIVLDAVNKDITTYAQYLSFQFTPATAAQLINNNTQILLLEPGQLMVITEVGGTQMEQAFLTDYLGVSQADADNVVLPNVQYVVGDALDITQVTVDGLGGRDLTPYADLSYSFDPADAHFDQNGNIVFDRDGNINITVNIIGAKGVVAETFVLTQYVAPCTMAQVILPAGPYVVGGSIDMSKVQVLDANGKDITVYSNLQFSFNPQMAHWNGTNLVFDQDGALVITTDELGTKTNIYQDIQTLNVVKLTAADVLYPTQVFYVGDVVPQSAFTVVDANGNDITSYAALTFSFAAGDAHLDQNGDIVVDTANLALPIQVNVAGLVDNFTANKTIATVKCIPAAVLFPNLADTADYKVTDSIDINSLVVVDAQGKDLTVYAQYLGFTFEPQGSAHIVNNYIVIDKPGKVKIFVAVGGAKMEQDTFVVRLGVDQVEAASVKFQSYNYIVGDTIALNSIEVYSADGTVITQYSDLAFSFAEGDAHLTADGDVVVDKAGQITINVEILGHEGVVKATMPTVLTVAPCTAAQFILPAGPYVVSEGINLADIVVISDLGRDITRYAVLNFSFDVQMAYMSGDSLYFEKSGQLALNITLAGPDAVGSGVETLNVEKVVAAQIIFPDAPQGGYYVENTINTAEVIVLDAKGKDITAYADLSYSFEPATAAHMDGDLIVIDEDGAFIVNVNVAGEVKDAVFPENIFVNTYGITTIYFQGPDYYVGQTLDSVRVYGPDNKSLTHLAEIDYTYSPDSVAIVDGQIYLKAAGYVTITMNISGAGIADTTLTKILYVRADDNDCYDLMSLVWDDLILVDNDNEDLPQFVSYKWYKDEVEIAGQSTQDYYVRAEDMDGEEHIYYVRAYDAQGKEYKICEKVFMFEAPVAAKKAFKVYPTMMSTADEYTVETSAPGRVSITRANGAAMDQYNVEEGKNSAKAPAMLGVYILNFEAVDGSINTQKLIVK